MDEKMKEVLEQYEFTVKNVYRVRGAYVLDTSAGLRIVREYRGVRQKVELIQKVKETLAERGCSRIDVYERNREGALITENVMGTPYVVKQWFRGEDCDLKKQEHLRLAGKNLAQLHISMQKISSETMKFQADTVTETIAKHNRELRRVKTYIREKKQRNEFELFFLSLFPEFYQEAEQTESLLKQVEEKELYEHVTDDQTFCHGSYNYHNLVVLPDGMATMEFEKTHLQLQVLDLYDFARKLMEKSGWNYSNLQTLLLSYCEVRPLSEAEKKILELKLSYPEKFWKITNFYFNRKKSWMSAKNIEKLQSLQQQKTVRQNLLSRLPDLLGKA